MEPKPGSAVHHWHVYPVLFAIFWSACAYLDCFLLTLLVSVALGFVADFLAQAVPAELVAGLLGGVPNGGQSNSKKDVKEAAKEPTVSFYDRPLPPEPAFEVPSAVIKEEHHEVIHDEQDDEEESGEVAEQKPEEDSSLTRHRSDFIGEEEEDVQYGNAPSLGAAPAVNDVVAAHVEEPSFLGSSAVHGEETSFLGSSVVQQMKEEPRDVKVQEHETSSRHRREAEGDDYPEYHSNSDSDDPENQDEERELKVEQHFRHDHHVTKEASTPHYEEDPAFHHDIPVAIAPVETAAGHKDDEPYRRPDDSDLFPAADKSDQEDMVKLPQFQHHESSHVQVDNESPHSESPELLEHLVKSAAASSFHGAEHSSELGYDDLLQRNSHKDLPAETIRHKHEAKEQEEEEEEEAKEYDATDPYGFKLGREEDEEEEEEDRSKSQEKEFSFDRHHKLSDDLLPNLASETKDEGNNQHLDGKHADTRVVKEEEDLFGLDDSVDNNAVGGIPHAKVADVLNDPFDLGGPNLHHQLDDSPVSKVVEVRDLLEEKEKPSSDQQGSYNFDMLQSKLQTAKEQMTELLHDAQLDSSPPSYRSHSPLEPEKSKTPRFSLNDDDEDDSSYANVEEKQKSYDERHKKIVDEGDPWRRREYDEDEDEMEKRSEKSETGGGGDDVSNRAIFGDEDDPDEQDLDGYSSRQGESVSSEEGSETESNTDAAAAGSGDLRKKSRKESIDINLDDPQVKEAAVKIQAAFKGFKTRNELKGQK